MGPCEHLVKLPLACIGLNVREVGDYTLCPKHISLTLQFF